MVEFRCRLRELSTLLVSQAHIKTGGVKILVQFNCLAAVLDRLFRSPAEMILHHQRGVQVQGEGIELEGAMGFGERLLKFAKQHQAFGERLVRSRIVWVEYNSRAQVSLRPREIPI